MQAGSHSQRQGNGTVARKDLTVAAKRLLCPETAYDQRLLEIVQAAAEVFREHGYDAGTLEDIGLKLGMTRPALYHYVRSKQDILVLMINYLLDRSLAEMAELERVSDSRERLRALMVHLITLIGQERGLFTVFFHDKAGLQEPYLGEIEAKEQVYVGYFRRAVREAMAAGMLPAIPEALATQTIIGMCNWTYQWLDPQGPIPLEQAAEFIATFLLDQHAAGLR